MDARIVNLDRCLLPLFLKAHHKMAQSNTDIDLLQIPC